MRACVDENTGRLINLQFWLKHFDTSNELSEHHIDDAHMHMEDAMEELQLYEMPMLGPNENGFENPKCHLKDEHTVFD